MTAPSVPSALPATFSLLAPSLTSLTLIGDGEKPAGPLYSSFFPGLKKLEDLHIEATALQLMLPDGLFDELVSLKSYALINNAGLTNVLPKSIKDAELETMYVQPEE